MVNKYYPPHIGGIEFHVRDLAEGLVAAGHNVKVLVANDGPGLVVEEINGVQVLRAPRGFEAASTPIAAGFARYLKKAARECDIVHFHFPYPWGEIAWWGYQPAVPYVVTYHTDIVRQKRALALYKPFLKWFLKGADAIIVSSPQMIENSEYLAPHRDKCVQINFGLKLDHIASDQAAARGAELRAALLAGRAAEAATTTPADSTAAASTAAHAIPAAIHDPSHRPIVLFVGRLVYYKGVDVLVRAMPEVDAEFVCIGTGPLRDEMVALATALGVADRLHILDPVDEDTLAGWYHAADVLALPSVERSEAFGLVQIEAHAAGTPTISSDLPTGVRYANKHGETGFSVPVGDPKWLADGLNLIITNDPLRDVLGAHARERALTEFNIEQMVDRTVDVYRDVARSYGRTDV